MILLLQVIDWLHHIRLALLLNISTSFSSTLIVIFVLILERTFQDCVLFFSFSPINFRVLLFVLLLLRLILLVFHIEKVFFESLIDYMAQKIVSHFKTVHLFQIWWLGTLWLTLLLSLCSLLRLLLIRWCTLFLFLILFINDLVFFLKQLIQSFNLFE